jgi:ABC-type transport system involved in multi-copper enzyme maturation permease subunit
VNALLRSELVKQRSTRTTLGLALAMLALIAFAVLLHSLALTSDRLATAGDQMKVFGWGGLGALFAALAGAMSITAEIRHGTIRPTFLVTPRRGRVIAAKATAAAIAGIAFGLLAEGVAIGLGNAALAARGIDVRLDAGDYAQLLGGGAAAAALWGPIGLGLGALLRNQVATLVGLFAWLLFVENLLLGQLPHAGRLLPGAAGAAIAGATTTGEIRPPLLAPAAGAVLLVLYAGIAVAAGWVSTVRRDVA